MMVDISKWQGIRLDIGCGNNKQTGFVGMDKRELLTVDIVHDLEKFPYPLPDECCSVIMASHIYEHIKPWLSIDFMNELWRIMQWDGTLCISTPYANSFGYCMDPTHCNPANEGTFQYFDKRFPLYQIYQPKSWKIEPNFPVWQCTGNLEIVMKKVKENE